jgi:hypothetical protein
LEPTETNNFASEFVELHHDLNVKHIPTSNLKLYKGELADEPGKSSVRGTIIDGVFIGTIFSSKDGQYFIESSKKYDDLAHNNQVHSIIYHENDVESHHLNNETFCENDKLAKMINKTVEKTNNREEKENKRRKRQSTNSDLSVCSLFLRIDPQLYDYIYAREGNQVTFKCFYSH